MNPDVLKRLRSNPKARLPGSEPTRQTPAWRPRRRSPFVLPLLVMLASFALALAGWSAVSNPALASMLIYLLMAAVLLFRPQGLFPVRVR